MIEVYEADAVTDEIIEAFRRLIPQLSSSAPPPPASEICEIVDDPMSALFMARDNATGQLVGSLTLAMYRIPTGLKAWIEDVVVDEAARGQGVGEMLTRAALDRAHAGASGVDLTSRPTREAANRLYQRIGFEPRTTNVYRYKLK